MSGIEELCCVVPEAKKKEELRWAAASKGKEPKEQGAGRFIPHNDGGEDGSVEE